MLPGLKTEGIRAVDCDKLPLGGKEEFGLESSGNKTGNSVG